MGLGGGSSALYLEGNDEKRNSSLVSYCPAGMSFMYLLYLR